MIIINRSRLNKFAIQACRNILELDFDQAREGQILAKTVAEIKESEKIVRKEVKFFVSGGFIKVRANLLGSSDLSQTREETVFEMVPGDPPDLPSGETLDELCESLFNSKVDSGDLFREPLEEGFEESWSDSMFKLEMRERAYQMTLSVLGA